MSITGYDKILSSMKTSFYNETGKSVDNISDLGVRFQAVASELYSISCYVDYALKQAFPQTATGEFLDNHAKLRGIERQSESKATGVLTFYLNEPSAEAIDIPQGTVCSLKDQPYIQFATAAQAVIPAGELSVNVKATAMEPGYAHNVKAGEINVMVNPPAGVSGVKNGSAFKGGMEAENDYSLRKRILSSFSVPLTGFNYESFRQTLLKNDSIIDCSFSKNGTELKVCVKPRKSGITKALINEIKNALYVAELGGATVSVTEAISQEYDLSVKITSADKHDGLIAQVEQAITQFANAIKIGESLDLLILAQTVARIDGVDSCLISSPDSTNSVIYSDNTKCLSLRNLKVSYNE